jgi:hypothetical protein
VKYLIIISSNENIAQIFTMFAWKFEEHQLDRFNKKNSSWNDEKSTKWTETSDFSLKRNHRSTKGIGPSPMFVLKVNLHIFRRIRLLLTSVGHLLEII